MLLLKQTTVLHSPKISCTIHYSSFLHALFLLFDHYIPKVTYWEQGKAKRDKDDDDGMERVSDHVKYTTTPSVSSSGV